jgi:hypothetical protein
MSNAEKMLDDLATLRETLRSVEASMQNTIESLIPLDIQRSIENVRGGYGVEIATLTHDIAAIEADIRNAVILDGMTARGQQLMAVFNAGRVSWDDKGLAGYAMAHPEITTFRKVGAPSVTIRAR